MVPYIYYPVLFEIGHIKIYTFGLMAAIAFITATLFAIKLGKKKGLRIDHITNIAFIALLSGVIGARLLYILEFWSFYSSNPLEIFQIWRGGLSWFGGLILAIATIYIYTKIYKLNFLKILDICTLPTAIGLLIGRIGCFLGDGGHVGKITTSFLGVMIKGELRHLTVLYSFMLLIPLIIFLFWLRKREHYNGFLFIIFILLYSIGRLIIDIFRIDPTYFSLTAAQIVSIILIIISFTFLIKNHYEKN